jgi:hypothetical protein
MNLTIERLFYFLSIWPLGGSLDVFPPGIVRTPQADRQADLNGRSANQKCMGHVPNMSYFVKIIFASSAKVEFKSNRTH